MIVISDISSNHYWEKLFKLMLNECDKFQVIFPDGVEDIENPLMGGKDFFINIITILKVIPSDLMENSSEYSGMLTDEIRQKFIKFLKPSFIGEKPLLWHFRLLKCNEIYLTCSDFTVCILEEIEEVKSLLRKLGIDWKNIDS